MSGGEESFNSYSTALESLATDEESVYSFETAQESFANEEARRARRGNQTLKLSLQFSALTLSACLLAATIVVMLRNWSVALNPGLVIGIFSCLLFVLVTLQLGFMWSLKKCRCLRYCC